MTELASTSPDQPVVQRASAPAAEPGHRYEPAFDTPDTRRYGPRTDALLALVRPDRLSRVERGYLDRSTPFEPAHALLTGARGRAYFTPADSELTRFAAASRISAGWYIVAAHGDRDDGIALPNERGGYDELPPKQFKRIMDNDPTWDGETPLLFISCETGPTFVKSMYELYEGRITMCGPPELATVTENGMLGNERRLRDPVTDIPLRDANGDYIYEEMPREFQWLTYARMPDGDRR